MIYPDLFNHRTSLIEDIEQLSDPNVEPSPVLVANFVVKYLMSYILDGGEHIAPSPKEMSEVWKWLKPVVDQSAFGSSPFMPWAAVHRYQLAMVSDVPATVEIVQEILSTSVSDIHGNGTSYGLDLWSWTWILLAAGHIQAKRSGLNPVDSVWIEINAEVAARSQSILDRLGFGRIIQWSTANPRVWRELNLPTPNSITNENLPPAGIPFHTPKISEPYLFNLRHLDDTYGQNLRYTAHFPRQVYLEVAEDVIRGALTPMPGLCSRSEFLCDPIWLRAHTPDHLLWSEELLLCSDTSHIHNLSKRVAPLAILLWDDFVELGRIGNQYRNPPLWMRRSHSLAPENMTRVRRWAR